MLWLIWLCIVCAAVLLGWIATEPYSQRNSRRGRWRRRY